MLGGEKNILIVASVHEENWAPHLQTKDLKSSSRYLSFVECIDLSEVVHIRFPGSKSPIMSILVAPGGNVKYAREKSIEFACDTAREMWRREVMHFFKSAEPDDRSYKIFEANEGLHKAQNQNRGNIARFI